MLIIWIALGGFLLMGLQYLVYKKYWDRGLKVTCSFASEKIKAGDDNQVILVVENNKRLPLPMLKVKFSCSRNLKFVDKDSGAVSDKYYRYDIFSLMSRQRITRKLHFNCDKRGYYEIGNLDILGSDIFLREEWAKEASSHTGMYVYPRPFDSEIMQSALLKLNGEIAVKRHVLEDPFEYRGIRPYTPSDERKSINWKATARTGDFKVNMRGYTSFQEVMLLLNLEDPGAWKQEDLLELSISITSTLAENFLAQGIRVSFATNGVFEESQEEYYVPAGSGVGQLEEINRILTMIDLSKTAVPFEEGLYGRMEKQTSDYFMIFISKEMTEGLQEKLCELLRMGKDFRVICPCQQKNVPMVHKGLMNYYLPIYQE